jgi:hypothetical protein
MEEVHHRNHLLVSIGLFLDENRIGCQDPWSFVEVVTKRHIDSICVLRGNTINIPLPDEVPSLVVKKTKS